MVPILPMPVPPSPPMWDDCARKRAGPRRTVLERHRLHRDPSSHLLSTSVGCGSRRGRRQARLSGRRKRRRLGGGTPQPELGRKAEQPRPAGDVRSAEIKAGFIKPITFRVCWSHFCFCKNSRKFQPCVPTVEEETTPVFISPIG